jgi:hypothetical protein
MRGIFINVRQTRVGGDAGAARHLAIADAERRCIVRCWDISWLSGASVNRLN